jgi:hypothetical protein
MFVVAVKAFGANQFFVEFEQYFRLNRFAALGAFRQLIQRRLLFCIPSGEI